MRPIATGSPGEDEERAASITSPDDSVVAASQNKVTRTVRFHSMVRGRVASTNNYVPSSFTLPFFIRARTRTRLSRLTRRARTTAPPPTSTPCTSSRVATYRATRRRRSVTRRPASTRAALTSSSWCRMGLQAVANVRATANHSSFSPVHKYMYVSIVLDFRAKIHLRHESGLHH